MCIDVEITQDKLKVYYRSVFFLEAERFRNIKEYLVTTRNQIKSARMCSTRTLLLDTLLLDTLLLDTLLLDTLAARAPIW